MYIYVYLYIVKVTLTYYSYLNCYSSTFTILSTLSSLNSYVVTTISMYIVCIYMYICIYVHSPFTQKKGTRVPENYVF